LYPVHIEWGIRVPMRDGVELAADLYRPGQAQVSTSAQAKGVPYGPWAPASTIVQPSPGPFPTIVVRTPYGRSHPDRIAEGRYFASHGYAVLVVDVRGRGDSDGRFIPYRNEAVDGYDTIEWAAAQPWSTGSVGTLGASYLARIQWLTALTQPPHLRAMIPIVTPSDPFVETPTGVPSPMHLCWLYMTSDRAVQNVDAVDWMQVYQHLPLINMDQATGRRISHWREEFEHPRLDEWWQEISYQHRLNEIDIPVLHISGWYDDEQIGTPLNYARMSRQASSERARRAQRLIMGPWPHQVNRSSRMGEIDFGPQALIDLLGYERRFFDRWLKGEENGLDEEPPVRIFVMGVNRWREEWEWPLARTEYTRWYLHSQGRANSLFGDGRLSLTPSNTSEPSDTYVYDPLHPTPFITEPTSSQIGGPDDYRPVQRRDDVLVYTSEPLTQPLEVTGPVRMELFASSTARDTDFVVQLHDVWPNGYAQRLCDGMVRARFRQGMDREQLLTPGSVERYEIDCWNTSHVFLPGHRIRVHVASSAFPKYDRNPNTGEPQGLSTHTQPAQQTVYHDRARPSAIILPVIKNDVTPPDFQ
jgi:putative CocE/NonD family hydrolase